MLDLTAEIKSRLDHFKAGLDGVFLGPIIRDAERALRDCCQCIAGALLLRKPRPPCMRALQSNVPCRDTG